MAKISIAQKKRERLKEWKGWISEFIKLNKANPTPDYKCITHASELLNDYYWRLALNYLKPMLNGSDSNLHYYKIISASELTVVAVQPFIFTRGGTPEERKKLNAEFAFFVATSIMLNWKIQNKATVEYGAIEQICLFTEIIDVKGKTKISYPLNFRDEHIDWLKDINPAAPLPVLSNSQTWRLCFFAAMALSSKTKKLF